MELAELMLCSFVTIISCSDFILLIHVWFNLKIGRLLSFGIKFGRFFPTKSLESKHEALIHQTETHPIYGHCFIITTKRRNTYYVLLLIQ